MFILKNFLCCMELETGGIIIGWIHLFIQVCVLLLAVSFLTIYDCSDFEKLIQTTDDRICKFERDFIAFALMLAITAICLGGFSYYNCIKATKERNFALIKHFMIFLAIVAVCSMYDVVFLTTETILIGLINGVINGYLFFVIFSLFIMFRDGPQYKPTPKNQHA